ncbi:MAG: hypothetical protein ACE5F9_15125, partial [Phycisphaerae bacterium]
MTFDPDALPVPDLGLRCLKCGYNLAGLPTHRCPECGRPFQIDEHIPRGDFPLVIFDSHPVPVTPEVAELLRNARIPFMDEDSPANRLYGIAGATDRRRHLTVPRDTYFEVIDLLRRHALGQPLPATPEQDRPDWTCPACTESNPGTFEVCWNCGGS